MANISIPGGHGSPLVFNVTGTALVAEIHDIAAALSTAFTGGTLTVNDLNAGTTTTASAQSHAQVPHVAAATVNTVLNTIGSGGNGSSTPNVYTLTAGGEYTSVDVGSATTVNGSTAGGDTIFGGAAYTYSETMNGGGANNVSFISGDNTYNGSAAGGDTVNTGSGHDTVNTGTGATTINGGVGSSLIKLNDTVTAGDQVYLTGGSSTVEAAGYSDAVYASSAGQTIYGAATPVAAGAQLGVFIGDAGSVTGPANDLVVGGAETTSVFDSVGGNTIFGGSGALFFVAGAAATTISDTLESGTGNLVAFGNSGAAINTSGLANSTTVVVAGGGNETLNGANGSGTFVFFGKSDSTNAATYNTSVTGGSGTNFFSTGSGVESITGGAGTNLFTLDEGGMGTKITISDFAMGKDSIAFGTAADSVSLSTGTVTNGNLSITLNDGTTVEFMGVTSLTGHTI